MIRRLGMDDVEAAIIGGCILGGGGGGDPVAGLDRARSALGLGPVSLWSPDELPAEALCATVALVGAPSAGTGTLDAERLTRPVEMLRARYPQIAAINTNENGAETTLNGWIQSIVSGVPLLDLACNGRAHPTGLMGAMGLHRDASYRSFQAFASGGRQPLEGYAEGALQGAAAMTSQAAIVAGGIVSAARNPVTIGYAVRHGAPGAISHAIALGRAFLDQGLAGLVPFGLEVVAHGRITDLKREVVEGLDRGRFVVIGDERVEIAFLNEYLRARWGDGEALFPDLIMLFDAEGQPLTSAAISAGMEASVAILRRDRLKLSSTMSMPELFAPISEICRPGR